MVKSIATIEGTALVPGISKNGRYYSPDVIAKAVARLSERIATGTNPAVMLTSHSADDDSRCIVGLLSSVSLADDGSARFAAQIADTDEGRKIASLIDPRGTPAFLKGVSIRGAWIGKVRREIGPDGQPQEAGSDLEIDGLDFTRKPGVPGAAIDTFTPAGTSPAESASDGRVLITESVQEALVTATIEEADAGGDTSKPYGDVVYADPGYQKDKKKRYPVDTKAHAKSAWAFVGQADNARLYTSAQLKRIKQRITKALKSFGVTVATAEGWLIDPATAVTEALAECWDMDVASPQGSLYVSLTNGPTTVTVSSTLLDAHDLMSVGRSAMAGALGAAAQIDPDMDGDIDVPGAPGEDTDDDMGSGDGTATAAGAPCPCNCGCAIPAVPGACPCGCESCVHCMAEDDDAMETAPQTPAPETPAAETPTQEKEPAMAESTPTPAAETPGTDSGLDALSAKFDKLTDAITGLVTKMAPAPTTESAPAAPVAEAAPVAVAETDDQRIARLVSEGIAAAMPQAIQEHVERQGPPTRKGLAVPVTEHSAPAGQGGGLNGHGMPADWPDKPAHTYTDEERAQYFGPALEQHVFGARTRG